MLLRNGDMQAEQLKQLRELFQACFGAESLCSRPATLRAIHSSGRINAHAGVAVRRIPLSAALEKVALLGLLCVHPDARGNRLGHDLVRELHAAVQLPFILNCGASLVPYYTQMGYVLISAAASYDRDGIVEIDEDPVLYFPNGCGVEAPFRSTPVHIGQDF